MPENKMNGTLQSGDVMRSLRVVLHFAESKYTKKAKV
jgi:hypothetical protein